MKRSQGAEILQEYWNSIRKDYHHEHTIEWVPKKGYYAYPLVPNYFFEEYFLGTTVREAKKTLTFYSEP